MKQETRGYEVGRTQARANLILYMTGGVQEPPIPHSFIVECRKILEQHGVSIYGVGADRAQVVVHILSDSTHPYFTRRHITLVKQLERMLSESGDTREVGLQIYLENGEYVSRGITLTRALAKTLGCGNDIVVEDPSADGNGR